MNIIKYIKYKFSLKDQVKIKKENNSLSFLRELTDELNKKDEELKEMINYWENTFNSIQDLISIHNTDFKILRANLAFKKKFGDDIIGKNCYEVIDNNPEPIHNCPYLKSIAEGVKYVTEEIVYSDDNIYDVTVSTILNNNMETVGFVHVMRDITQKKKYEKNLKFLSQIAEQVSDAIIITDMNYEIIYINKATEKLYGYELSEVKWKNPNIFNGEKKSKNIQDKIRETISKGKTFHGIYKNKKKNGDIFICDSKVSPMIDKTGDITHHIGVARDVTKEVNSHQKLKESEQRFRTLADFTKEGLIFHDNGYIIDVNKAVLEMFGYEYSYVIGKTLFDFLYENSSKEIISKAIKKRTNDIFELPVIKKNGTKFFIEIEGKDIKYQGKTIRVALIRDISRRYEILKQIQDM